MTFYEKSRPFCDKLFFGKKNSTERYGLMFRLSQAWSHIQASLFPVLETEIPNLTPAQKEFAAILDLIEIDKHVPARWWSRGRPNKDRKAIARAFIAKTVFNFARTSQLLDYLHANASLRRLCGWERAAQIPSESTFSRAFDEFAQIGLPAKAHEALIKHYHSERLVGHLSRDATDIPAREKPLPKPPKPARVKAKMGRPRKGEVRPPKEPSFLERQPGMSLSELLAGLPRQCDWGAKKKGNGLHYWKGYKLHVDWADGEIPVSWLLTSASFSDCWAAIPLARLSAERVCNLYDLMDSAYDAKTIREHSLSLGHVPIIERNPRRREVEEMAPARKRRYFERTTAERGFSLLKDNFGAREIRVRGHMKVMTHVGFSILALTAQRLVSLLL
jgi:hypothetical protein